MTKTYAEGNADDCRYRFPAAGTQLDIAKWRQDKCELRRSMLITFPPELLRSLLLTAQADVAPINSNTAPRSHVANERVIAVTTSNVVKIK